MRRVTATLCSRRSALALQILIILFSHGYIGCVENVGVNTENMNADTESTYLPISDSEIELTKVFIDSLPKLYPVDESNFDSGFYAFKVELLDAISKRDTTFIFQMLDSNILNSFGGDGGLEEFKQSWRIDSNESIFWDLFRSTLEMGGTFSEDTSLFVFPYVFTRFPLSYDPFSSGALIKDHGVVYRSTDIETNFDTTAYSVFETLQWTIINVERNDLFVPVKTGKHRYGFVKRSEFRSPIGYRGGFHKKSSTWKLRFFVAGD